MLQAPYDHAQRAVSRNFGQNLDRFGDCGLYQLWFWMGYGVHTLWRRVEGPQENYSSRVPCGTREALPTKRAEMLDSVSVESAKASREAGQ